MDNNNDIIPHNEPAMANTSGVKYKSINRRSSSSSSSSSCSSSSSSSSSRDSRKKKKRASRHRSKKRKRDRRLEKLSKEVNELRKNMISYDNRNYLDNDNISGISDVSRDLYDDLPVNCSQGLSYTCNLDTEVIPHLSFDIETKLKDPAVPPAPQEYLKLNEVQRFDNSMWSDIRYADTQKLYNHSPGFTELETNEEVKAYDNTRHLAYSDKSYAPITFCILKQKESVLNSLRNLLAWSKSSDASLVNINDKIEELFLKGEFHKVSTDLLQMTFGHRAEAIEMRRDSILKCVRDPLVKVALNKIPPSNSHIFNSEALTAALDKAGGVRKAFWPVKQLNSGNALKAKPGISVRHPSQGYAYHYVPSRDTPGYCCEPAPAAHTHYHQNQPSQGSHQYQYPSRGRHNANRGHTHSSFRTRGSRSRYANERGQKRSLSPSYNTGNKKHKHDSLRFQAGRLAQYHSQWQSMGAPDFILKIITGYRIPFIQKPPMKTPNLKIDQRRTTESIEMSAIIQQMKQQGVLDAVVPSPSFVSPLFLVPKSDGTNRPVFNLRLLNQFVLKDRFRLINMYRVSDFLQPRDWMCKADLAQAYFNLPIFSI